MANVALSLMHGQLSVYWQLVTYLSMVSRCWSTTVLQNEWPGDVLVSASADRRVQVFSGELKDADHFHEMFLTDDSLIVGARNAIYNISLDTFKENSKIVWNPKPHDVDSCLMRRSIPPEECQNYIRVITRRNDDSLLVCGTNAYRPMCRTYTFDQKNGYTIREEESGQAKCPYDPKHNSTAVYVGNHLYSATVADLAARDALIFRKPIRTEMHDSQWLNEPNFVRSLAYEDRVYFFFREMAVENINCGKAVFSRVARVCVNDQGGARVLRHTWTSFSKARLNCSVPGEFPFYFNEIQSTSVIGEGHVFPTLVASDRVSMVYAVFNTPRTGIRGSAICAFKMTDIIASFEGPYKEQRSAQSNWLPVRDADVPVPHPAKMCGNNSSTFSDQTLNFIKSHPLVDRAVPAFGGRPILVQSSFEYSLTQIAVDWQVYSADRRHYDVLFIGTDNGRVVKAINRGPDLTVIEPTVIEVITVFDSGQPVTGLQIHRQGHSKKLIVMSRDEIRTIPLHRCHLRSTCSECVALRDPYCSWMNNQCTHSREGYQSIQAGRHVSCPQSKPVSAPSTSAGGTPCVPCSCKGRPNTRRIASNKMTSATNVRQTTSRSTTTGQSFKDVESKSRPDDADYVEGENPRELASTDAIGPCYGESLEDSSATEFDGYSSGAMAAVALSCIFLSLLIGFVAGFGFSRYQSHHRSKLDKKASLYPRGPGRGLPKGTCSLDRGIVPKDTCSLDSIPPNESGVVENWYGTEPRRMHSFGKYNSDTPPVKQQNSNNQFYVNDFKKNNSMKNSNSAFETTLQLPTRHQKTAHL